METKVYVINWIGDYENDVVGIYTTLEKAKQELLEIANNYAVTKSCDDGLSFVAADGAFYCINEAILYS